MTEQSPAEALFFAALEKRTPEERAAYLDGACGDDRDLRQRVERLLAAHPQVGSFLEPALPHPSAETASFDTAREAVGAVIAERYKLLEEIGEGGMGTVYMAQQTEPVKRLVAVKVTKTGMDSKAVLARFEAERQALALMDHPNIAKVFDGGITEQGRPFFVMELVKGVPITGYCDDHRLTPRERLELFVPVCQAVQHAHQKGIIHRDLKPSNVLVAQYDGRPVPKVIDFGVAKATGQPLTDKTLVTGFGAIVGTPEYMSPEQTEFNQLDIDTRSDVYALGVLLYELLTGSTPFSRQELEKAGLLEILRVIREQEPPRPSVRLSTADALPAIAAKRGSEPKSLAGLLRNELDWMVMKALEKDRNRRYDTATGFASDVQRYLAGEAIQAHPPSRIYRLRKFARKNRVVLTTAAMFAVLLLGSAVVSGWLAVEARRAQASAEEKRKEAEAEAKRADQNAGFATGAFLTAESNQRESERRALGLQVDLDLAESSAYSPIGLLRLCRTLREIAALQVRKFGTPIVSKLQDRKFDPTIGELLRMQSDLEKAMEEIGGVEKDNSIPELREFVTAAILAEGQDYAPLLPPITHDGQEVTRFWVSPDHRTLLTLGKDRTVRLWDIRTARSIAVLQKENEQVFSCGFSPDGRTAFTDDLSSIARFWDVSSGKWRSEIDQRSRYVSSPEPDDSVFYGDAVQIGDSRFLTRKFVKEKPDELDDPAMFEMWQSPVELWDTASGRLVARLDGPDRSIEHFRLVGEGRWVTTVEGESTLLVFAGEDGRLVGRLRHPTGEAVTDVAASPSGRRMVTITQQPQEKRRLRFWDTGTWQPASEADVLSDYAGQKRRDWTCWTDDLVSCHNENIGEWWTMHQAGGTESVATYFGRCELVRPTGELALLDDGQVYDTRTWQRLMPPQGRKFHASVARFAMDGRFVSFLAELQSGIIDTRTDKLLPTRWGNSFPWWHVTGFGSLQEFGIVQVVFQNSYAAEVRIVPTTDKLNLAPDLLELWVQVAVRGELNAEGAFVTWDEQTWERKRQELVAQPVPFADFPFPGYVATDGLHWLRAEFASAEDVVKPRLAEQLLDRAETAGEKAEAVRWRAWLAAQAPTARPQPNEGK